MCWNFNWVLSLLIITLQISRGLSALTDSKVPAILIVNPDTQNDTNNVKDQVDNIREVINGDEKIPVATSQQLHDISDVRHKIEAAIKHGSYAKGTPVPMNINVKLHAKKDDELEVGQFGSLNIGDVKQLGDTDNGKSKSVESDETSMKKDLSKPIGRYYKAPCLVDLLNPNSRFSPLLKQSSATDKESIVLEKPSLHTIFNVPSWLKSGRNFVSNFFDKKEV